MAVLADTFGVPATIRPPGELDAVDATVIWFPDVTYDEPMGSRVSAMRSGAAPFSRREPRRVMAVMFSDLVGAGLPAAVPAETRIVAPLEKHEADAGWMVDSEVSREWDHVRVVVIPDPQWVGA